MCIYVHVFIRICVYICKESERCVYIYRDMYMYREICISMYFLHPTHAERVPTGAGGQGAGGGRGAGAASRAGRQPPVDGAFSLKAGAQT